MTARPSAPDAPILVTGATGTTGSRVLAALRREGVPVRAASRTPRPTGDPGIEPVRFSWENTATWDAALAGARGVYVLGPLASAAPDVVLLPFVDRARKLGVGRIVLLSASPVAAGDPGLGRVHEALAAGPSGWAVLRPTWFTQNLVDPTHHVGAAAAAGEDLVTATGTGRVGFVDAADIAAVAARALLDPMPHDTDHVLTGPEALSYDDVAEILSVAHGRTVRHRAVDEADAADVMVARGIPREYAGILAAMETAIAGGSEDHVTDTVLRVTGRPPRSVVEVVAAEGPGATDEVGRGRTERDDGRPAPDARPTSRPVPQVYLDHLAAVTGPDPASVRELWEPDGVLEFPYAASVGTASRLEGVDAIVGYFDGLRVFRDWTFSAPLVRRVEGAEEWLVELHGSATLVASGAPYEQDYVVRFGLAPSGRLAWMREFWDPTRTG